MIGRILEAKPSLDTQMSALIHRSILPGLMAAMAATVPPDIVLRLENAFVDKRKTPFTSTEATDDVRFREMGYLQNFSLLKCVLGVTHNLEVDLRIAARPSISRGGDDNALSTQERRLAITLYTLVRESLLRFTRILDEGNAGDIGEERRTQGVRAFFTSIMSKIMGRSRH
ncbi:hypothetical protein SCHPADRAFT_484036 [Schizopora paradoxa]|uniref:Uncharacterized protein n=1 Tax=Schizopora paradoxa TaxID=27342 RepID=A0A0H2RNW7_9AGAM|nr:hypothetical protein SCHPADRAFT_484036 [Schizopora paradoxa]